MSEQEFESRMAQAETMLNRSDRRGYFEGYIRGLRRFYQGPTVETIEEHERWLSLSYEFDEAKADWGRGYQHGLQGIKPVM